MKNFKLSLIVLCSSFLIASHANANILSSLSSTLDNAIQSAKPKSSLSVSYGNNSCFNEHCLMGQSKANRNEKSVSEKPKKGDSYYFIGSDGKKYKAVYN